MKDVTGSFVSTGLIQCLNVISGILLARYLLPEGRGELAVVMLWPVMICGFGILGVHEAIAYAVAKKTDHPGAVVSTAALLGLVQSIPLILIGMVVIEFAMAGYRAEVREAARLYLVFIPLNFLVLYLLALFQGSLRFEKYNLINISIHLAFTVLVVLLCWLENASVWSFALASLLANMLPISLAIYFAVQVGWRVTKPRKEIAKDLIRYGLRVHLGKSISLIGGRLDQILISILLAATDLGLFVVGLTLSRLSTILPRTLGVLAFTKIATAKTLTERREVFGRYLRATILTLFPVVILVFVGAPWLLELFFGAEYGEALILVRVLTVAMVAIGMRFILVAAIKGFGRPLLLARCESLGLVLSVITLAVLLPAFGIIGAAFSAVIARSGAAIYMGYLIQKHIGINFINSLVFRKNDWTHVRKELATLTTHGE